MTGIDAISGAIFLAAFLGVAAYRLHAHGRLNRGRMVMFLGAAVAVTFTAAFWFPGLYRFASNGVGLALVGGLFAWGLVDTILQVGLKHTKFHPKKTAYAVVALGVAGMLLFANVSNIKASMHSDFSRGGVTQVLDHVVPVGPAGQAG